MLTKFDVCQMVEVAQMYYLNDMEQDEIAHSLQISTSLIPLILAKAVEVGIVEIKIRNMI